MTEEQPSQPQSMPVKLASGTSMRDMMGPLMVDQAIRQAIQHCWMMLLEEERSADKVEEEITRIVRRALKDLREDAVAFGFSERQGKHEEQLAKIRAEYPKAYDKWSEDEDGLLKQKFAEGTSIKELSKIFQRQPSAIRSRLIRFGLVKEQNE